MQVTNQMNLFRSQLGAAMPFAALLIAASCRFSLAIVLCLCAKMKMCRIHTLRIMAIVKDRKFAWDGTMVQAPRNTMRPFRLTVPNKAVPILVFGTVPQPTSVINEHLGFKAFAQSFAWQSRNVWLKPEERVAVASVGMAESVVVTIGCQVKMGRPHATWIVAVMPDAKSIWNRSERLFPNKPVNTHGSVVHSDCAISSTVGCSCPQPAIARTIHELPEAQNGMDNLPWHDSIMPEVV